ncbi:DUF333 domain-containing protein [Photorhabdus luminescens]|nr:DUF333 domain-containing protein [Photorhabdus luminescens]
MKKAILATLFFSFSTIAVAMPNPASVFCGKLGGESQIVTQKNGGELSLCVFKNGTIIEEWTLFRMYNGDKK